MSRGVGVRRAIVRGGGVRRAIVEEWGLDVPLLRSRASPGSCTQTSSVARWLAAWGAINHAQRIWHATVLFIARSLARYRTIHHLYNWGPTVFELSRCIRTPVRGVKCGVWSVECAAWSVQCAQCAVRSVRSMQ